VGCGCASAEGDGTGFARRYVQRRYWPSLRVFLPDDDPPVDAGDDDGGTGSAESRGCDGGATCGCNGGVARGALPEPSGAVRNGSRKERGGQAKGRAQVDRSGTRGKADSGEGDPSETVVVEADDGPGGDSDRMDGPIFHPILSPEPIFVPGDEVVIIQRPSNSDDGDGGGGSDSANAPNWWPWSPTVPDCWMHWEAVGDCDDLANPKTWKCLTSGLLDPAEDATICWVSNNGKSALACNPVGRCSDERPPSVPPGPS
jgi:hypothetical protein